MTPLIPARSPPVEATGQGPLCLSWATGECGLIACRCLRLTLRSDHPALDLKVDMEWLGRFDLVSALLIGCGRAVTD
jgi:hypothetical protein